MATRTSVDKNVGPLNDSATGMQYINQDDVEDLQSAIAEAAYYKAEKRGFTSGDELWDWLEAEREIREQRSSPLL